MDSKSSVADQYRAALDQHGDSPAAVFWPKGRQDMRFTALTRHLPAGHFSLLDYGCGLAHLKPFLDARFDAVDYVGADMVEGFLDLARGKYPDARFIRVDDPAQLAVPYDHAVLSGVFNMLYHADEGTHREEVWRTLEALFAHARVSLAVNFMTDHVDFRQPGSFHLDPRELIGFIRERLSRRYLIDQSYMPFEYTAVIWKDDAISRPEMVFG